MSSPEFPSPTNQQQAKAEEAEFEEEEKLPVPSEAHAANSAERALAHPPGQQSDCNNQGGLQRKQTRRDSILDRVREHTDQASAFTRLRDQIVSYSTNLETLMDIFKAKSYKQNIKSKSRQSETLVISKQDFFDLIRSTLSQASPANPERHQGSQKPELLGFSGEDIDAIEQCVQLTPKFPAMYAVRHIETLFQALIETVPAIEQQAMDAGVDLMHEEADEGRVEAQSDNRLAEEDNQPQSQSMAPAKLDGLQAVAEEMASSNQ